MTCSRLRASALCCSSRQVEARKASRTQWAGSGRRLTDSRSPHRPWSACGDGHSEDAHARGCLLVGCLCA
jgi:hypothetical protein